MFLVYISYWIKIIQNKLSRKLAMDLYFLNINLTPPQNSLYIPFTKTSQLFINIRNGMIFGSEEGEWEANESITSQNKMIIAGIKHVLKQCIIFDMFLFRFLVIRSLCPVSINNVWFDPMKSHTWDTAVWKWRQGTCHSYNVNNRIAYFHKINLILSLAVFDGKDKQVFLVIITPPMFMLHLPFEFTL